MQYHGYEIDPEYIAKDAGVPDWHSAGLGEFVVGRKGGKRWFIKRNNEYRFPTEKEQPDKELRDYYLIPAKKYQADREALRRLMVEKGGLTAEKDHIVPEVEHFIADGRIVLVSQYVENIARDANFTKMEAGEFIAFCADVAELLKKLHACGVIHGDLKVGGADDVMSGNIALGALTAATTYVTKIISHITQISRAFFMMQNQLVSGGRLKRFLTEKSAVPDCPSARVCSRTPHIAFRDVSFTLGDKQVLKHISLDVPYGKKVGLMGGTGSGKSALLKMLSRIFDATAGEVDIDGVNIKEYPLEQVRAEYAYVFQDVFLFSNTVDANVAFARPDCSEEDVFRATSIAQASRFVEKLPDGYSTIVGERGMGLSGGQKQRISIARALVKGAPVLILDDASSALDMATEKRVLSAIKRHCPEHTLFIATHRVSSVVDCDEILFLRDGEIVERGTAQELIQKDGAFAAIWRLQTSDGQLDDSSYGAGEE